ncbi:MAG: hypothetical protein KJ941_02440 [Bacteroidetes bacterium]|nr:hypothetical protein [Bacteroidota bacterium]
MKYTGNSLLVIVNGDLFTSLASTTKWIKLMKKNFEFKSITFILYISIEANKLNNETDHIYSLSEKEINLFGQPKNKKIKGILKESYDSIMTFGEVSKKLTRILNKNKSRLKIGSNVSKDIECAIRINSNEKEIIDMTNFTTETIQKIAFK